MAFPLVDGVRHMGLMRRRLVVAPVCLLPGVACTVCGVPVPSPFFKHYSTENHTLSADVLCGDQSACHSIIVTAMKVLFCLVLLTSATATTFQQCIDACGDCSAYCPGTISCGYCMQCVDACAFPPPPPPPPPPAPPPLPPGTSAVPGAGTLQAALDAASLGDVLVLADGTYTAGPGQSQVLSISKSITIRAQHAGQAVLDGEDQRRGIQIDSSTYDCTVVLEGLVITKARASDGRGSGVQIVGGYAFGVTRVTFNGCEIHHNGRNWGYPVRALSTAMPMDE